MIQGLVFDCDGTLADTMPAHWVAWRLVAERHRFAFTEERFYALGGVPSRHIVEMLSREQGIALNAQAIALEKERAYLGGLANVAPVKPVVAIALEHHGKLPMAVASGGTRPVIEMVLARLGIRHCFQAVVTSEDVVNQKPAPDIFLEAARRIGVTPERCRGFEDTDLGMQAIRAAGMDEVDIRELLRKDG
ncbi:MAG: HAD-IA family hydrolase [Verrucomicrobia bacterium]|nr:HAD-IA family hydrolase [Verrucomicrobiota bacterium]